MTKLIIDRSDPGNSIADVLARWPRATRVLLDSTMCAFGRWRALASALVREPAAREVLVSRANEGS